MNDLEKALREKTTAEVRFDEVSRYVYASDASIFEIEPQGVALPKTKTDLIEIIRIARDHRVPIIARGAATGIAGGCIGKGLVVDMSKYMTSILEINFEEEFAIVEPGVVLDDLNAKLSEKGYKLGPETSTSNRATIAGMIGNNASGMRSIKYGKMSDALLEVEILTSYGETITLRDVTESTFHQLDEDLKKALIKIRTDYRDDIESAFPKLERRVSGYNLDELIKPFPINLAKLAAGSEGTLGLISKAKLRIVKKPKFTGLLIVHFSDLKASFDSVSQMLHWNPSALEMLDHIILEKAKTNPSVQTKLSWLKGEPQAILIAEFEGSSPHSVRLKISTFEADLRQHSIGYAYTQVADEESMRDVWDVRKAGLGLLMSIRSYTNALAFLEDIAVPPESLASFMPQFLSLLSDAGKEAGIYGHVGSGCMHIRPYVSLKNPDDLAWIEQIMIKTAELLLNNSGALSGEHGDGEIRSWLNEKIFGPRVYEAFKELKMAFDPFNLMNPGKVVDGIPFRENWDNLRINPDTKTIKFHTFFDFSREGGFDLAVDMCNGNGLCRKKEGTMCPSYQATHDEYDSTRARANALRSMIHGKLGANGFSNPEVYNVLDLCLQCKACKTECPSEVDMAKMKSEFLYQYQKKHGIPLRSQIFSYLGQWMKWAYRFPFLLKGSRFKNLMKLIGISPERTLPPVAKEKFSKWFEKNIKGYQAKGKRVVLFLDTYTEYSEPEIGKCAVKILNALGYEVIVPQWKCCGRPAISKGLLDYAKKQARHVIETYTHYAKSQIPIIGLEPSCLLTLADEYRDFKGLDASLVSKHAIMFDDFLYEHLENGKLPLPFKKQSCKVKVHGHCHQKSLNSMHRTLSVLRGVAGFEVEEIPSGCCGMAGSFGYEIEHYDLSMKIGELILFPAVRDSAKDTIIIANGFSCRTQIADGAGRSALHLAEAIAGHLQENQHFQ